MARKKKSNKKRKGKGKSSQPTDQPPPPTPAGQAELPNDEATPLDTDDEGVIVMPDTGCAVLDMVVFFKQCVDHCGESEAAKTYQSGLDLALKSLVQVYVGPDARSAPSILDVDDDYFTDSYSGSDQER